MQGNDVDELPRWAGTQMEAVRYSTWNGRRYLNQYRMGRRIGKGLYSNVRIATDPLGVRVAVKYYFKSMCSSQRAALFLPDDEVEAISVLQKVVTEIDLHQTLSHRNIGSIFEVLDDTEQNVLYVVMDFFPTQCMTWDDTAFAYTASSAWYEPIADDEKATKGHKGRLLSSGTPEGSQIAVFTEDTARHLMKMAVDVLSYLQSVDVVHKDIKPDNIMLNGYFPPTAVRDIVVPPLESAPGEARYVSDVSASNELSDDEDDTGIKNTCDDEMSVASMESDVDEFLWSNSAVNSPQPPGHESVGQRRSWFKLPRTEDVQFKLIDFNTSVRTIPPAHLIWDSEGTRLFTPPECFMVDRAGGVKGFPRDVWSLGCFLYCAVFGRTPFWATSPIDAIHEILRTPLKFPSYVTVSEDLIDLLKNMLEKDPTKRFTLDEIKKHQWMVNNRAV